MKISELSKSTGVSQRMIRYFEELGLISPQRSEADYRVYEVSDRSRIIEIREWQRLGLTLKEVGDIIREPQIAEKVIENVFVRERAFFLEKQKSLQDLRVRLARKEHFENRIAYSIPNIELVMGELGKSGWTNSEITYLKFSECQSELTAEAVLVGEIIWQSAFYLLNSDSSNSVTSLKKFMASFCKAANNVWSIFDGHPPQQIDKEDAGEFFSPSEIVVVLEFRNSENSYVKLVLPYQAIFALAKASQG